jgi:GDP-mannose 6-dehydrogenase
MRVSVFGLGYVGAVTAACLARAGHEVVGVDVSREKVAMVNGATPPVAEPGLAAVLAEVVPRRLRATTSSREAVAASEVSLVCVGTPGRANGRLEAGSVQRVTEEIGAAVGRRPRPHTVVLRSTLVPGTTETVVEPALRAAAGGQAAPLLRIAVNPEFMREGTALADLAAPPFTLAGAAEPEALAAVRALYAWVDAPFVAAGVRTAEMVKYAANAFHALKICFANEIGEVCRALGADAQEVMRIFRLDRKLNLSEAYLRPGFAFGGSCLPKDLRALLHAVRVADVALPLLGAILPSNEARVREAVEAVLAAGRRRVGVVGLAFKPGTDDLRESPLVTLVETLIGKGCEVRVLDRHVAGARLVGANLRYLEQEIPHVASRMCEGAADLLAHAEVVVVGNAGEEAAAVLAGVGPGHVVVDLTGGAVGPRPAAPAAA